VQCLAPFEPREPSRSGGVAATRVPWLIAAVGLGAVIGVGCLVDWRAWMAALQHHTLLEAEIAIIVGALPGYLLSQATPVRRHNKQPTGLDRMYAGPATTPPPLPGYTHYLPCALLARDGGAARIGDAAPDPGRDVAPGVMYVGPSGIRFEPRAGVAGSARAGFDIGPVRMVKAHPVELARRGLSRVTTPARYAMLMQWPGGRALFAVPSIGDTLPRLHDCLDTLRFGPRV
jgi:hypothetical protein